MPEENKEVKDIQGENLQEEHSEGEAKRRIKPVIEEIVTEAPAKTEESKQSKLEGVSEAKKEVGEDKSQTEPIYERAVETPSEESKSDIKLFVIVAVITALVVAALAGGIYVYITGTRNLGGTATPTPEATLPPEASPLASPTSSPSAALKLSSYRVQVLNGSGRIGEAGNAKALLEKAGFKVGSTGNAATFDFTDTIIQTKTAVAAEVVSQAKTALADTYSVKIGDALDLTSDFDLVITVGTK